MKTLAAFISVFALASSVMASGTMELAGKVRSFSPDFVEINDGHQIYSIARKKLGSAEKAQLQNLKFGAKVKLVVPFEAVAAVKPLK